MLGALIFALMVEVVEIVDQRFPFLEVDGYQTMTTQQSKLTFTIVLMDIEFLVLELPTALVVVVVTLLLLPNKIMAVVEVVAKDLIMEQSTYSVLVIPETSVLMLVVIKMVPAFKSMAVGKEHPIKDGNSKTEEMDGV